MFEQFKAMPSHEQEKLKELVNHFEEQSLKHAPDVVMPDEAFRQAKDHVFANYGPLLEELAK